jgi:hypothetical protein
MIGGLNYAIQRLNTEAAVQLYVGVFRLILYSFHARFAWRGWHWESAVGHARGRGHAVAADTYTM